MCVHFYLFFFTDVFGNFSSSLTQWGYCAITLNLATHLHRELLHSESYLAQCLKPNLCLYISIMCFYTYTPSKNDVILTESHISVVIVKRNTKPS